MPSVLPGRNHYIVLLVQLPPRPPVSRSALNLAVILDFNALSELRSDVRRVCKVVGV
jgi:hypothetical protein